MKPAINLLVKAAVFSTTSLFVVSSYAICPLCTIAVGAGVGLAQWLGVDDTATGIWIGGLTVSLIGWTIYWFDGKNIAFKSLSFERKKNWGSVMC